ncbi:partial riboflavin synthase, partial [Anaerolineae bacterium]
AKGVTRLTLDLSSLVESQALKLGDSVAINGCCLTVAKLAKGRATFEAIPETLKLTNLGALKKGSLVNAERALKAGARLDGHLVQGHVDQVGTIEEIKVNQGERRVKVKCGVEFGQQCVRKGSVCLDGISLTIAELGPDSFTVAIIPHTWEVTNLRARKAGDEVNLEADTVGKYVLAHMQRMFPKSTIDEKLLKRAGYM